MMNGEWRMMNDAWRMMNDDWQMRNARPTLCSPFVIRHSSFVIPFAPRNCRRFILPIVLLSSFVICHSSSLFAAQPETLLRSWLAAQTNVHTWSAELVQIRSLKTFAQPVTNHGRVWFATPDRFRWEIGSPAATIAVRQQAQLLVIYPKLHRAERYPLDGKAAGPWKEIGRAHV